MTGGESPLKAILVVLCYANYWRTPTVALPLTPLGGLRPDRSSPRYGKGKNSLSLPQRRTHLAHSPPPACRWPRLCGLRPRIQDGPSALSRRRGLLWVAPCSLPRGNVLYLLMCILPLPDRGSRPFQGPSSAVKLVTS